MWWHLDFNPAGDGKTNCLSFVNLILSSSGFFLISEWALWNEKSLIHYPPVLSILLTKMIQKVPNAELKSAFFPGYLPPLTPLGILHVGGVLRLRFRELLLRTSPTQSPLSEAQRCWMVGWEPGLSGPDEGAWHRAWNSVRVLRLLVDCAISTVGTGYWSIAIKSGCMDFCFKRPNVLGPLNLCSCGDQATMANRHPHVMSPAVRHLKTGWQVEALQREKREKTL